MNYLPCHIEYKVCRTGAIPCFFGANNTQNKVLIALFTLAFACLRKAEITPVLGVKWSAALLFAPSPLSECLLSRLR